MEFIQTWFTFFQFTVFVFRFVSLNNNFVESTTGDGVNCLLLNYTAKYISSEIDKLDSIHEWYKW